MVLFDDVGTGRAARGSHTWVWLLLLIACGDDSAVVPDGAVRDGSVGRDGGRSDANVSRPDAGERDAGGDASASVCATAEECDDGFFCNGVERCLPGASGADAAGCLGAESLPCGADEACGELGDACLAACDLELCRSDADCEALSCAGARCNPTGFRADAFGCENPSCDCTTDEDCADEFFCNGVERCDPGSPEADERGCRPGLLIACVGRGRCRESMDRCCTPASCPCETDADCDDGLWCNGIDRCSPGHAMADAQGCVPAWAAPTSRCVVTPCDEAMDCCLSGGRCLDVMTDACRDRDLDGDGHDAEECGGDDCADGDANRFRGNIEVCDPMGHDEDCDLDTYGARDSDADGFDDAVCCNVEPGGTASTCGVDCDDARSGVHPTAVETCNDFDDDCDGAVDEFSSVALYRDRDGDGFGAPLCGMRGCVGTPGYVAMAGDCNDAAAAIRPGENTCGTDASVILVCGGDGTYTESACPPGTRCTLQPDGSASCL